MARAATFLTRRLLRTTRATLFPPPRRRRRVLRPLRHPRCVHRYRVFPSPRAFRATRARPSPARTRGVRPGRRRAPPRGAARRSGGPTSRAARRKTRDGRVGGRVSLCTSRRSTSPRTPRRTTAERRTDSPPPASRGSTRTRASPLGSAGPAPAPRETPGRWFRPSRQRRWRTARDRRLLRRRWDRIARHRRRRRTDPRTHLLREAAFPTTRATSRDAWSATSAASGAMMMSLRVGDRSIRTRKSALLPMTPEIFI